MKAAFHAAFQKGARQVVLHGTDIPGLTPEHLETAFSALRRSDLVLGPSTDGGYWLMGLRKPADLFDGMEWGSSSVFDQTLAAARAQGISVQVLSPLTDMDTAEALRQHMPEWAVPKPYVSVIIPTLNEERKVGEAIRRATSPDAEIIVVDGGSEDRTVDRAEQAGAKVLKGPRGRAKQQNRGAEAARAGVLLFLHADTILPQDYVAQMFETMMDRRVVLGAFCFKTDLHTPLMRAVELLTNLRARYLKLPYGDQALFIRRAHFQALGGFPDLAIGEDLFFVRLALKSGLLGIAPAPAITSGRRWETAGPLRTTLVNQLMLAGFALRISPESLAGLYHRAAKKKRRV